MTTSSPAIDRQAIGTPSEKDEQPLAERPTIAQLLLPYWRSEEKIIAITLLSLILGISFSGTYTAVELNDIQGKLTDALVALDWTALKPLFVISMVVGAIGVILPIISTYCSGYLDLRWRTWMTRRYLEKWTANANYYVFERDEVISNADQRIAEDIRLTTESTLNMFTSLTGVVVSTVTYTILLWNISGVLEFRFLGEQVSLPGYMVYAAYIYCFFNLVISHWLGKALIGLNMQKQTVEADFRHQGMQLREYAEQIAFYKGGDQERAHLNTRFEKVRKNALSILAKIFKVMFGQSLYGHIFSLLPTLLALPLLLSKKISYGDMISIVGAYAMLSGAIAFFPQVYTSFTTWLALTNRLRDFQWAINKAELQKKGVKISEASDDRLICDSLALTTPSGKHLATLEAWSVQQGERWLVSGRSGSGKSTLLRACAGLWPYGDGEIHLPLECSSLFIPQKSYIPTGTLKAALCYPEPTEKFSDDLCRQALVDCQLPTLVDALTVNDRWQYKLSGGEQQRFAMARALLHKPDFLFLDEATSALDPDTEHSIYSILIEKLCNSAIISVAHRESLEDFHQFKLKLTH